MKLLIESWNKHLKENITQDQKEQTLRILSNWFGYEGVPEEVFQKIPIFRDTFIKRRIGSGTAATAFELGNGNVLRLYNNNRYMGHRSIEEEDKQYEKVMSRTFGGSSKKGDVVVYAHGIIEIESQIDNDSERKVGWVEMNKVLTLPNYYTYMNVPPYIWEEKKESFDNLVYDIKSFLSDFSLTENEDEWDAIDQFQNSVYGVKGVRGIFTCYIGNAISRFLHNSGYTTITARNRKKARLGSNYNLGQSRLSLENMLRAGLPEINETIEVVIEEYNGNNRIPTSILDLESDVARRVSRISLLDPWTKVKNSTNNNDLFGRINQMATKLYGSNEDTKYTMGQYIEHNKVIINQLNFNTTKIRIRLNFTSADIRLSDLDPTFTENTDEIFDLISWQKPYKRNTSPLTQEGDFIYFSLSQLPKNQGKPIAKFVSKNGVSRGLITGLNLNLIPLLDEKRNDYYTYNIGSVISNTQTKVPSTLII